MYRLFCPRYSPGATPTISQWGVTPASPASLTGSVITSRAAIAAVHTCRISPSVGEVVSRSAGAAAERSLFTGFPVQGRRMEHTLPTKAVR